jgi:hypothetical protein
VLVTPARHAAGGAEEWIAEQLHNLAAANGYGVMCGRLYTAVDLRSAKREIGPRPVEGEWVCEQHPNMPWPHDDCAGPGMPAWDSATHRTPPR